MRNLTSLRQPSILTSPSLHEAKFWSITGWSGAKRTDIVETLFGIIREKTEEHHHAAR